MSRDLQVDGMRKHCHGEALHVVGVCVRSCCMQMAYGVVEMSTRVVVLAFNMVGCGCGRVWMACGVVEDVGTSGNVRQWWCWPFDAVGQGGGCGW